MFGRQAVCNDPRVLQLLGRFIPTADFPHRYRLGKEAGRTQALEYRLLYGALRESSFRNTIDDWFVQGMYVITPSGKLIAGGNRPLDVESTLADMRKGLAIYQKMPRDQRLLRQAPHPRNDRMLPAQQQAKPPAGGLVLRAFGRGVGTVNVSDYCPLRPPYYKVDRLWYTREEATTFLPPRLQPGAKKQITGPIFDGMAQLYLKCGGPQWQAREVKEGQLTSEVTAVNGVAVSLRLTGHAVFDANSQYNKQKYRPDMVGYLTYDTGQGRFTRFELLAYGQHSVDEKDRTPGGSTMVPYGILITLNGSNVNDNQAPSRLHAYPGLGLKAAL
ncbi:MAG: hypothetical protein ACO1SX_14745 [Actinomycetota bacterium]